MRVAQRFSGTIDRVVRSRAALVFAVMATVGSAACSRVADRGARQPRRAARRQRAPDHHRHAAPGSGRRLRQPQRPDPEHRSARRARGPLRARVFAGAADAAGARVDPDRPAAARATASTATRGSGSTIRCRRSPRVLKAGGYRTGAFVGAFVLDGRFGLNRGFDDYDDRLPHSDRASFHFAERRAADVVDRRRRLDPRCRPGPAVAPAPSPSARGSPGCTCSIPMRPTTRRPSTARGRTPYDAEVAYADAMLGQLLDRLDAAHALDRTLVVLTADHGESLGEHGEMTHGLFAYDCDAGGAAVLDGPSLAPGDRRRAGLARRHHADDSRPAGSRTTGIGRRPVAGASAGRATGRCISKRSTPR